MYEYTVAELLAETIYRHGIGRIYGIIGTTILDFIDTLYEYRDKIQLVTTRHEQVAVSAADGEARVTGRLGVAVVHAGPGFLNAAISLGIALRDRVPLLLISGGVKRRLYGTESWLEIDQGRVSSAIAKSYWRIGKPEEAAEYIVEAVKNAYTTPRGPVVLEVAEDIWRSRVTIREDFFEVVEEPFRQTTSIDEATVKDIADRLASSEKPLLFVCGEVVASPFFSQSTLLELSEKLDVPIVVSGNARGACPEDNPKCLGRVGFGGGSIVADRTFEESDYLLVLGNEFDDIHTYAYTMLPQGEITVTSLDPAVEKRPPYYDYIEVDPAQLLTRLAEYIDEKSIKVSKSSWWEKISNYKKQWGMMLNEALNRKYTNAVNPALFFKKLNKRLPRRRIVSSGQGTHILYTYDFLEIYEPRTFLAATNLGAMSYALPAAIGAKLAKPDYEVVAVVGDGDFMMTIQDLETIRRENIPVKIIVVNDNAYRVLYLKQVIQKSSRIYGTLLGNPDFVKLSESMGVRAMRIDNDELVEEGVEFLLSSSEPTLVELVVDKNDIPPLNMDYTLKMSIT